MRAGQENIGRRLLRRHRACIRNEVELVCNPQCRDHIGRIAAGRCQRDTDPGGTRRGKQRGHPVEQVGRGIIGQPLAIDRVLFRQARGEFGIGQCRLRILQDQPQRSRPIDAFQVFIERAVEFEPVPPRQFAPRRAMVLGRVGQHAVEVENQRFQSQCRRKHRLGPDRQRPAMIKHRNRRARNQRIRGPFGRHRQRQHAAAPVQPQRIAFQLRRRLRPEMQRPIAHCHARITGGQRGPAARERSHMQPVIGVVMPVFQIDKRRFIQEPVRLPELPDPRRHNRKRGRRQRRIVRCHRLVETVIRRRA